MRPVSPTVRRVGTIVLIVVVLAFFAYAVVDAWDATHGELPSIWRIVAAVGLWMVGLVCAGLAWSLLLGGDHRVEHGASLIVAQLGKYVPGGVFQASGQVALARSAGVSVRRGATAFSVLAICQAVAGCSFLPLLAFAWPSPPGWVRAILLVGGVASLALIDRRWMVWTLRKIPRTRDAPDELVPGQAVIVRAWLTSVVTLGLTTVAYVLLLGGYGRLHDPLWVVGAYAAAWTAGFVVIPIPSGLGIREAVLVAILHGAYPSSVLVATSVYLRLTTIAAEGLMALVVSHRVRPARLAAIRSRGTDEPEIDSEGGDDELPRR